MKLAFILLGLVLLLVALARPELMVSGFFAPTALAVSVALALWIRRSLVRRRVNRLYRNTMGGDKKTSDEDESNPTVH